MKSLLLLIGMLLSVGCAQENGFARYYVAQPNAEKIEKAPNYETPPKVPQLIMLQGDAQEKAAAYRHLRRQGYFLIGASSFYGPSSKTTLATDEGKKVGAYLVTLEINYRDTVSGTRSFALPNPNQTMTATTNVYGSRGVETANTTMSVPGGYSQYSSSYSIDRNNYVAGYWAKFDITKGHFGAQLGDLSEDVRSQLHRNTGAGVAVVYERQPAFYANILEGDLILKMNDVDVTDEASFRDQLKQYWGQTVTLDILRPTVILAPYKLDFSNPEHLSIKVTLKD